MKVYQKLALTVDARQNCIASNNTEWRDKHEETILELVKATAPSGSGIDCGTEFDFDKSTGEKLVFNLSYHHMNENGMYDGWTEHAVTVRPSLGFGFELSISGKNRNSIKEYLHDVYHSWLNEEFNPKEVETATAIVSVNE